MVLLHTSPRNTARGWSEAVRVRWERVALLGAVAAFWVGLLVFAAHISHIV